MRLTANWRMRCFFKLFGCCFVCRLSGLIVIVVTVISFHCYMLLVNSKLINSNRYRLFVHKNLLCEFV